MNRNCVIISQNIFFSFDPDFTDPPPSTSSASSSSNPKFNKYGGLFVNGQPLSTDIRKAIIELSNAGMKQRRISKELKVSQSTISKILSRYKVTGSILPDPRGGFRNHNSLMRHSLTRLQQQQHQLQTEHLLQNQMSPLIMHSPGQSLQQQQQQFSATHLLHQQQQAAVRQQMEASQMSMAMPQLFLQQPMNLASTFENTAEHSILPVSLRQVRRPPPPPPEPRTPSIAAASTPTTSINSNQQQSNTRPTGRRKHAHVSPPESPPPQETYSSYKHDFSNVSSATSMLHGHTHHHASAQSQQFERLKIPMQWPTSASCSQAVASWFSSSYTSTKNANADSSRQQSTSYRVPKKRPNK